MATTGVLPPNTRSGQSFIHDPRVSGSVGRVAERKRKRGEKKMTLTPFPPFPAQVSDKIETKAQIKLRMRGKDMRPMVVVRSFQVRLVLFVGVGRKERRKNNTHTQPSHPPTLSSPAKRPPCSTKPWTKPSK